MAKQMKLTKKQLVSLTLLSLLGVGLIVSVIVAQYQTRIGSKAYTPVGDCQLSSFLTYQECGTMKYEGGEGVCSTGNKVSVDNVCMPLVQIRQVLCQKCASSAKPTNNPNYIPCSNNDDCDFGRCSVQRTDGKMTGVCRGFNNPTPTPTKKTTPTPTRRVTPKPQ